MPNYCENTLTVSGDPKSVREFVQFAKGENGELDFNRFVPYPERFARPDRKVMEYWALVNALSEKEREMFLALNDGHPKDGFNSGGHEWCQTHWGTKWNACSAETEETGCAGEINYHFNTAWTPPKLVIKAMSKKFPELCFSLHYEENGNSFAGDFTCQGGDAIEDDSWDIPYEEEED